MGNDSETGVDRVRTSLRQVRVFDSERARRQFTVHVLVGLAVVGGLTVLVRGHLSLLTDPGELSGILRGFGVLAPAALVGLQVLQVVLAPIPGQVLGVVAGYLFGAWWGTLYSMIGITLGSTVAFWLSRRFGRPYVARIAHDEILTAFDDVPEESKRVVLFVVFLLPGLPDDAICFVGGLTNLPLWQLVGIAILGRTPAFFLVNVIGEFLATGRFSAAAAFTVVLTLLSVTGYLYRERLFDRFDEK